MSYEEGLKHEQSGDYFSALSIYRRELDSDRLTRDVLRGLFRSTLKVGDIHALSLDLIDLCKSTGISSASAQLMQGRLHVEIGENERARDIANELDSKFFGVSEILELELLRANMLALDFRFNEAIELLKKSDQVSPNHWRRIAEFELAAQRPESAVVALKFYVQELNKKNASRGRGKRFITASGFIFNLANQVWLEQKFPETKELPSLLQSMKALQEVVKVKTFCSDDIFYKSPKPFADINSSKSKYETLTRSGTLARTSEVFARQSKLRQESHLEKLIEFTDGSNQLGEFSRNQLQGWELQYTIQSELDLFAIEESGIAVWSNFKICSSCNFVPIWNQFLISSKRSGRKDFLSHLYPAASNIALYALWIPNGSGTPLTTITFNRNGSVVKVTGTPPADSSKSVGEVTNIPGAGTLTRSDGLVFCGWNTKPNGSGTNYHQSIAPTTITHTNTKKVTLFANWKRSC